MLWRGVEAGLLLRHTRPLPADSSVSLEVGLISLVREDTVLIERVHRAGLRGWHLHLAAVGSIILCIGLWIRAKTVDQDEEEMLSAAPSSSGCGRRCSGSSVMHWSGGSEPRNRVVGKADRSLPSAMLRR